ncbi:MAG: hypothetical protein JEY71_12280 [Sphaerochaeta sp.]|nr:hypothetical protein [Sphaerochaeta sp.]
MLPLLSLRWGINHKDYHPAMTKRLVGTCILALFLLGVPLYSTSYSPKTINVHSSLYEETDLLYRLHGLAIPSGARPWSTGEAALILSIIPDGGRTASLKKQALSHLETALPKQDSNGLSHRFSTTVAVEAYTHTNTTDFKLPQDWSYNMDRRLPLFDFRMELQWDSTLYFATSVEAGASVTQSGDDTLDFSDSLAPEYGVGALIDAGDNSFTYLTTANLFKKAFNTNLMTFDKDFQDIWPRDSQITLGGAWWNVSLGRGPIHWGVGQSGNLIIGNHFDSMNSLNINFFSEEFKLQFLYLFLPNPLGDEEEQRIFMGHRLETQSLPWLRFTITENVMFKGESLPLNYIDPTYIYHNHYNSSMLNAIASLELHLALQPGLSLYSEFALDQYQFANEGGSEANAMGLLVGMTHSTLLHKGILSTTVEFVGTDPSLYRRNGVDFLIVRGLTSNSDPLIFDYLGYKWGSDSIVLSAEMVYLIPEVARYSLNALIHRQGEVTLFAPHHRNDDGTYTNDANSNIPGPAPSGDIMTDQIIVGFQGSWWLPTTPMRFFTDLSWIGRRTYGKSTKTSSEERADLQLVAGMVYTF